MAEKHSIMGGKVHLYKRVGSPLWQCSTYLAGKNRRISTKEESLARAKDVAEGWYLDLRGRASDGQIRNEKSFRQAADQFIVYCEAEEAPHRNEKHVKDHQTRLRNHLLPFFGKLGLSEVNAAEIQRYRQRRMVGDGQEDYQPPSRSTFLKEMVTLRQVLLNAERLGWLAQVPDTRLPQKAAGKVVHRAWFSREEYQQLYLATRQNAKAAQGKSWQHAAEQLHDLVLFMANTGLRPDEIMNLQYRDVKVIWDDGTDKEILLIEVRGKRGVGFCKSMPNAVTPFRRLERRNESASSDQVFPENHKKVFNRILDELDLKLDRNGNRRTLYSLRHSYICFRLLEGADIYQVAKNCRTSVEMIEKHYAAHLQNQIDAAAVNVRSVYDGRKKREQLDAALAAMRELAINRLDGLRNSAVLIDALDLTEAQQVALREQFGTHVVPVIAEIADQWATLYHQAKAIEPDGQPPSMRALALFGAADKSADRPN